MFNKLIRLIKNRGSYDVYVAYLFRLSPHFSQSSVARPFKRRPIRPRGLKGAAGILDSMSKSLEGARLIGRRLNGLATELCEKCGLGQWQQETTNSNRVNDLYFMRGVPCVPPLLSFNEIPKYRGIDNLNTTLHLIINNFIKNQHKTVLHCDCITNSLTTNQRKTALHCDFITNSLTTNQRKTALHCDFITNSLTTNQRKTALHCDFITNSGRFLTNNFITNQQINANSVTLGRGRHQNKEIVQ